MSMETKHQKNGSGAPDALNNVLSLPTRRRRDPQPDFPRKMLVAVDGWPDLDKVELGGRTAESLGGVLVDSGRFHRALVKACRGCDVDMTDATAVADFCGRVTLHTRLVRENWPVEEAQVAVNDRWFSKCELLDMDDPAPASPALAPLRKKVHEALRLSEFDARVVMVGSDIGTSVFPETPYKFFLDSLTAVRNENQLDSPIYPGAGDPKTYAEHHFVTRVWNGFKVLMMDTGGKPLAEFWPFILGDCVLRAMESGVYGRKRQSRNVPNASSFTSSNNSQE